MFIFLYGNDTYRSLQKLNQIREKFKKEVDPSGINIVAFDAENFDLEKFNNSATQAGFLVAKRLIIVKNLLQAKLAQELSNNLKGLLNQLKTSVHTFIFWEEGVPDQRTSLFKLLSEDKKYTQIFEPLEGVKLNGWAKDYLKERGGQISPAALALMVANLGNNLWQLANELAKLTAYKAGQEITETDVKNFVTAKVSENIFGLTDAIAQGNQARGLKLLQEQFQTGLNENYILTMIVRQFRIIAQLKSLLDQGYFEPQIVATTKLHPYVVKKTLPQAKKFSLEKIRAIYQKLLALDKKLKSTPLSPPALLSKLIMEI